MSTTTDSLRDRAAALVHGAVHLSPVLLGGQRYRELLGLVREAAPEIRVRIAEDGQGRLVTTSWEIRRALCGWLRVDEFVEAIQPELEDAVWSALADRVGPVATYRHTAEVPVPRQIEDLGLYRVRFA